MDALLRQFEKSIEEDHLLRRGDRVVLGLSGGPDSVFLLHALVAVKEKMGIAIHVLHVNHQIRGEEAVRDAAFAEKAAEGLHLPFRLISVDAPGYAESHGLGLEEAARILRYRALEDVRRELAKELEKDRPNDLATPDEEEMFCPKAWIAVAHHLDDQAETILHNLIRGSGIRGISGMERQREHIIRPLLSIKREDILKWLKDQEIPYVVDSTNLDLRYTRNRIRNVILPEMKSINPEAAVHITETASMLREAGEYFQAKAAEYVKSYGILKDAAFTLTNDEVPDQNVKKSAKLMVSDLKKEAPLVRRYVMMEIVRKLDVPLKDWTKRHFTDMDQLIFGPGRGHLDLPSKVSADYVKKCLIVSVRQDVLSMKRRKNHGTACKSSDSGRGN